MAAKVDDAFHAGDGFFHLREIDKVGGDEILAGREIGGFAEIARPNVRIDVAQDFTQPCADIASSAGNDNLLHRLFQLSDVRRDPSRLIPLDQTNCARCRELASFCNYRSSPNSFSVAVSVAALR